MHRRPIPRISLGHGPYAFRYGYRYGHTALGNHWCTPLHLAVFENQLEIIERLIMSDPFHEMAPEGSTHYAWGTPMGKASAVELAKDGWGHDPREMATAEQLAVIEDARERKQQMNGYPSL